MGCFKETRSRNLLVEALDTSPMWSVWWENPGDQKIGSADEKIALPEEKIGSTNENIGQADDILTDALASAASPIRPRIRRRSRERRPSLL
jgi:hypothetical protein